MFGKYCPNHLKYYIRDKFFKKKTLNFKIKTTHSHNLYIYFSGTIIMIKEKTHFVIIQKKKKERR